jgi:hypothetical protein
VTFSERLITGSLAYTVTPPVSDTLVAWNGAGTVLTVSHGGLVYSQTYTVTVAAQDLEGLALVPGPVPNPWSFTTAAAPPPVVLATDPADGAGGVSITTSLVVTFSEPLITGSLAYTVTPPVSGTLAAWNGAGTVLTVSHGGLAYSQTYTVTVAARDLEGRALVPGPVPNPWSFTTVEAPPPPPRRIYLPLVLRGGGGP